MKKKRKVLSFALWMIFLGIILMALSVNAGARFDSAMDDVKELFNDSKNFEYIEEFIEPVTNNIFL